MSRLPTATAYFDSSALRLNRALISHQLPPLILVSSDHDLLAAAVAEGLTTDNPDDHP